MQVNIFCTTFVSAISNGALVQLVRIRACHARGQGFESPTHRRNLIELKESDWLSNRFFLCVWLSSSQLVPSILTKHSLRSLSFNSSAGHCLLEVGLSRLHCDLLLGLQPALFFSGIGSSPCGVAGIKRYFISKVFPLRLTAVESPTHCQV